MLNIRVRVRKTVLNLNIFLNNILLIVLSTCNKRGQMCLKNVLTKFGVYFAMCRSHVESTADFRRV